ncbi:MAG: hypothetical protein EOP87_08920 [Verrucomicrobiaceae bacterium]|nr:MAG: hypothetical protein EOP87_08920 [Verrucomicrobiaceae bacterium]
MTRSFKISILASILILAVAVAVGWRDRQQMEASRQRNARLISQAAVLGISPSGKPDAVLVTKREREHHDAEGKREATELLGMLGEADAMVKRGENADASFQQIMARLVSLGPDATEFLITDIMADRELDDEARGGILRILLLKLSTDSPQAMLRRLHELPAMLGDKDGTRQMHDGLLKTSLASWGKKDPRAVAKWIRENGAGFPGVINDSVKSGILSAASESNPALALSLIDEMGIEDKDQAFGLITRAARTAEGRTATLAALRARFSHSPQEDPKGDVMREAVRQLAIGAFTGGYDQASKWLEGAGLASPEMEAAASALDYRHTGTETGRWLDWLGQNLPADRAGEPISRIMTRWTELDYQAAGRWLAAAPEGPVKSASVQAYAIAVSGYEPATAAQWAMTLPAGKGRDATLLQIHQNWPKEQTAARDAFAKEHGIE